MIEDKVSLGIGIYADAQKEPDIEKRFAHAKTAADRVKDKPGKIFEFYQETWKTKEAKQQRLVHIMNENPNPPVYLKGGDLISPGFIWILSGNVKNQGSLKE